MTGTHRHRIIQGLEGHGGDPKSNGEAVSDCEQRSVPRGVWRATERTREDAGTLQSRQARQTAVQERGVVCMRVVAAVVARREQMGHLEYSLSIKLCL